MPPVQELKSETLQTPVTKLSGQIENILEKRIPTSGSNDRSRIMDCWRPVFKEIAEFATKTPVQGHLHMKVWARRDQVRGHDSSNFYHTDNMCDIVNEGREQIAIFGITLGSGNWTEKMSPDAFVGDLQIRFFSEYATITTWHERYQNHLFATTLEKFLKTVVFNQDYCLQENQIATILSGSGEDTETTVTLKQGLLFAAYWKQMIIPMLHKL